MHKLPQSTLGRLHQLLRLTHRGTYFPVCDQLLADLVRALPPEEVRAVNLIAPALELMVVIMAVDKRLSEDERAVIHRAMRELTGGYVRSAAINRLTELYTRLLLEQGCTARIAHAAELLRYVDDAQVASPDSEVAFTLAAAVIFADGSVHPDEQLMLEVFVKLANMPSETVDRLLRQLRQELSQDPAWKPVALEVAT